MSALTVLRRGRLAGAIIPATALAIAGIMAAQTGAQASPRSPALHAGSKVTLGTTTNVTSIPFTQAPNGAVFYARGSVVYVVTGTAKPKIALHAGGNVLALAASASDLFVQSKLTVTEYRRSNGKSVRHWTLPAQPAPFTSAGLLAVGSTVWAWNNTETDGSGLEFAWVDRINTAQATVHVVNKWVYSPGLIAGAAGLYFESTNNAQSKFYLSHASPSGAVTYKPQPALRYGPFPLALAGGKVEVLAYVPKAKIDTFNPTTLALVSSKPVFGGDYGIASSSVGLIALGQACKGEKCSTPVVSKLNPATGTSSGSVKVTGAFELLPGPSAVVLEVTHYVKGTMALQRISS